MRPSWRDYFMNMAELVATRSQCHSRQVGAVIVRNKHCIATGYNGVPSGVVPCGECLRHQYGVPSGVGYDICPAVHAEANAIAQAAKLGISTVGATMYINCEPCKGCVGLTINAGIVKLVARGAGADFEDLMAVQMIRESGLEVEILDR